MHYNDNLLIICPDAEKNNILKSINKLIDIKFINIQSFIDNYFYKYDYRAISFVMNEYKLSLDISKMYMENLYFIDINKKYNSKKLEFLREIKNKLISNNLLEFNNYFKEYLKNKNIMVMCYPKLEKYLLDVFKKLNAEIITKDYIDKKFKVYECNDINDEVCYVIYKIIDLYKSGVSLNHIFISNCNDEYFYIMDKFFKMFNIPITMSTRNSIYNTFLVKNYLESDLLPDMNDKNSEIINKLVRVKNKLVYVEDDTNYKLFLQDEIKKTYLEGTKYRESVHVVDLFERSFSDDDYVFVLGFNENILPIMYKDENYITDCDKEEVNLFSTREKNKREKEITIKYLSNISNLYISYKLSSFKDKFYPSSMITDYSMDVIKYNVNSFLYSNSYNLRSLSIFLDNYYKYGEENKYLKQLYKTYKSNILYNTYSNSFTGINKKELLEYMKKINLSYTSMNTYNLCKFRYYINYVLKLDPFEDSFATLIGNLFHHVLEVCFEDGFDFDVEWNRFLKNKTLSIKESFFLERLKVNLLKELDIIKEQRMYTDFKNSYYEKNIIIPLNSDKIEAYFTGKIDKIMYYKDGNNTYFSLVDYKTGSFDANINNIKYGIGMQLATYLYLVEKANIFENPILAGMYYQKVFMGNVSYDGKKDYLDKMRDNLKLVGYSTNDEEVLSHLDHEYTDSKVIRSMKVTKSGFSRFTKLLTREDENNIFKYTEKIIYNTLSEIINGNFEIDPKRIDQKDVSCKYCKYRDLCYVIEDNYKYLEKVNDLSFLGGE